MTTVPKPTTVPVWDTTLANLIAPTAGHQSAGYANSEVPASNETNGQLNLQGQWHAFANALASNGGGAVANLDVGNTAEATTSPIIASRDYLQNIRSLTDHNGYRMGQVTEYDENWNSAPVIVQLPMASAVPISGTWVFTNNDWVTSSASAFLALSIGSLIPAGALITAINVHVNKTVSADVISCVLQSCNTGTITALLQKNTSAVSGSQTVAVMTSPTTGHGPLQLIAGGAAADDVQVQMGGATWTGVQTIYGIAVTYVMPPPGWSYTGATTNIVSATVGDSFAMVDAQSGLNQRGVQLLSVGNSVAGTSQLVSNFETYIDANCAYVIEFMLKTGTITDGSNHRSFFAGFSSSGGLSYGFSNTAAQTVWQLNAAASLTATAVTVAASTVYRMRLEIYGSNLNSSGSAKFRGYINGVKVAEVNVTLTADKFQPYFFSATSAATGGPYDITIGRVRRAWNHLVAGDNL